eukprot:TRINITY_DN7573_c0_g1_i1.p2 TRINITY_DN7573_c0_g1~~TRINITY_DN7573_c0_g1_i1.p2  ORF type:complete len:165 (+),score=24.39 TRINITY_DN7573_c0_g1_i1:69-497(+)
MAILSVVRTILTFLLAAALGMAALNKLSPVLSAEMHTQMQEFSVGWATVPPFKGLVTPVQLRQFAGVFELVSAILFLIPATSVIGNFGLIAQMAGAVWIHVNLQDGMAPIPGVLLALLVVRYVLPRGGGSRSAGGKAKPKGN